MVWEKEEGNPNLREKEHIYFLRISGRTVPLLAFLGLIFNKLKKYLIVFMISVN